MIEHKIMVIEAQNQNPARRLWASHKHQRPSKEIATEFSVIGNDERAPGSFSPSTNLVGIFCKSRRHASYSVVGERDLSFIHAQNFAERS